MSQFTFSFAPQQEQSATNNNDERAQWAFSFGMQEQTTQPSPNLSGLTGSASQSSEKEKQNNNNTAATKKDLLRQQIDARNNVDTLETEGSLFSKNVNTNISILL
eukprot:UN03839